MSSILILSFKGPTKYVKTCTYRRSLRQRCADESTHSLDECNSPAMKMPMRHPLPLLFFSFFSLFYYFHATGCDRHRNPDQNYAKRTLNANSDTRAVPHHGNSGSPLAVGTPLGHMIILYDSRLHIHSIEYIASPAPFFSFPIPPSSISVLFTV